jgi:kynureninase
MKYPLVSFEDWIKLSPTTTYNTYVDLWARMEALEEHIEDLQIKEAK